MNKRTCQRCMKVEKVASFNEFEQVGEPVPWRGKDDEDWGDGLVECPHRRGEVHIDSALVDCLHRDEQLAVEQGTLLVEEEARR